MFELLTWGTLFLIGWGIIGFLVTFFSHIDEYPGDEIMVGIITIWPLYLILLAGRLVVPIARGSVRAPLFIGRGVKAAVTELIKD